MSRKKGPITRFDEVASNSNIENDSNLNSGKDSILKDILSKKTKDDTHVFRGYYLEKEVAQTIERLTAGKAKGVKSELVNNVLKKHFKEEGLL